MEEQSPQSVSIKPSFLAIKKRGIRVTELGIIIVARAIVNNIFFPKNSFLAKAYAASEHTNKVPNVEAIATIALLSDHLKN